MIFLYFSDYMTLARDCMSHYFVNCSNTLSNDIDGYMNSYKSQYCEDNNDLKEYITTRKYVLLISVLLSYNKRVKLITVMSLNRKGDGHKSATVIQNARG